MRSAAARWGPRTTCDDYTFPFQPLFGIQFGLALLIAARLCLLLTADALMSLLLAIVICIVCSRLGQRAGQVVCGI